jgi:hypothetical protein
MQVIRSPASSFIERLIVIVVILFTCVLTITYVLTITKGYDIQLVYAQTSDNESSSDSGANNDNSLSSSDSGANNDNSLSSSDSGANNDNSLSSSDSGANSENNYVTPQTTVNNTQYCKENLYWQDCSSTDNRHQIPCPDGSPEGAVCYPPYFDTDNRAYCRVDETLRTHQSGPDSYYYCMKPPDQPPPTANAGSDQTVSEGQVVQLDGSSSSDSDGYTLTYAWNQTAGTPVTLSDASSATPSFTAPNVDSAGDTLNFELTVNYDKGGTAKDSVNIIVQNDVPIASLTANPATINESESSSLDASGSSSSTGIATYKFTQTAVTRGTITHDSPTNPLATFTAPEVVAAGETATIQVEVTDNDGDNSTATADIAVKNVNKAPVAKNQTVSTDEDTALPIRLTATDPDGDALTYTIVNGPLNGTLSGTAPDVTYSPAANYNGNDSFTFKVSDGIADSNIAEVSITLRPVNDNPTVNTLIADPTTINEGGGKSALAASATDPDGDSLTYSWSQTAGTAGKITVDSTDPSKAIFEAASVSADETATVQVTVDDGSEGGTDSKTVAITVKNVNQAPLAKLTANPTTIDEGKTSALDASGSTDPDAGDSLTYSFATLNSGPGTITDQTDLSDATATYNAPSDVSSDETVTIEVTVTDSTGATSTDNVQITVKNVIQLPIANAGADFSVDEGTRGVQLKGSGTDNDGTITSYLWEQTAGPTVTLSNALTATATFDAPSVTANTPLTFNLTVTDNDGATAEDTVVVTVKNVNQLPTANAGQDKTVNEGDRVTLDGSGSTDPDGTIASYSWTQTAGTDLTLDDNTSKTLSFTAPGVGSNGDTLTFELKVTDNDGATSIADTVSIKVNDVTVNQPPLPGGPPSSPSPGGPSPSIPPSQTPSIPPSQTPSIPPSQTPSIPPSSPSPGGPSPSEVSLPPSPEPTPMTLQLLLIITAIGASVGGYVIWKLRHRQGSDTEKVLPEIEVMTRGGIENRHRQGSDKTKVLPEIGGITRGGIGK